MASSIVTIAQKLGISPSTVSRALSRPEMVSEETRRRILDEAREQGYITGGKNAARENTRMIGVLAADLSNTFSAEIVNAVQAAAAGHDFITVVGSSNEQLSTETRILKQWEELHLRGLIVMPAAGTSPIIPALAARMPVTLVDRDLPDVSCDKVLFDEKSGMEQCIEHLQSLGHERIVLLSGSQSVYTFRERAAHARSLYPGIEVVCCNAVNSEELYMGAFEQVNILLMRPARRIPTAIIAANTMIASGVMYALNLKNVELARGISLIYYGDATWMRFFNTPISAVRQPTAEMGERAAEEIFARIKDPQRAPEQILLSPMLMPRASTGSVN